MKGKGGEEEDKEEAEKGHDFGGAGARIQNAHLVEAFNPLKKFYASQAPSKLPAGDKGGKDGKDDKREPVRQKEMV